jgi:probable HAF family extracellular repeat protein
MARTTKQLLGSLTATALLAGAASAQATFEYHLPDGASRITPDGLTVVGNPASGGGWMWTAQGGFTQIGGTTAVDLSDDASVVTGNMKDASNIDSPAIWDAVNGWRTLGGLPGQTPPSGSWGTASAISADGSVVVGLGWLTTFKARGFRWDAVNGMVQLPQLGTRSSRAYTVSADLQWIGGWDEHSTGVRRAALWDANLNETLPLVRPENTEGYGELTDISPDGSVMCGHDYVGTNPKCGFVMKNGQITSFGSVPGVPLFDNYNWANAVSDDGSVAVGGNWDLSKNTTFATIWTESTGVMFLSDYLTSLGVQGLDQVQLANALDISADGTTILGWGVQFPFSKMWWKATIPSCHGGTASFCITSANSVGSGALIGSNGNTSIASNSFELSATGLPANVNGIFFYGPQAQQLPFGNGVSCVGSGGIGTFRLPLYTSSASGMATHMVDFTQLPAGGQITAGSTWNFQAWYRDAAAGGAMFNTSDALRATFCD